MSEMVERVARGLAWQDLLLNADEDELNRAGVTKEGMAVDDCFVAAARAAIEAMREPTTNMAKAGSNLAYCSADVWTAMLDAALSEKP